MLFWFICLLPVGILGRCVFPKFLQQNNPWISKYTRGYLKDIDDASGTFRAYIKSNVIKAAACPFSSSRCSMFERKCQLKLDHWKFIVDHRDTIYVTDEPRYMCMQFLKRSSSIVQIRVSNFTNMFETGICNDGNLTLDNWPLILSSARKPHLICPFRGKYHMQIRGPGGNICKNSLVFPSLESECEKGNGILFDFSRTSCNPKLLHMNISQNIECVAQWTHRSFMFVILSSKSGLKSTEWCLRLNLHGSIHNLKNAVLFVDPVCDPGDDGGMITETKNYYIMALQKIYNDPECRIKDFIIGTRLGDGDLYKCHTLCERCLEEMNTCSFQDKVQGHWLLEQNEYVTITSKSMSFPQVGSFHCILSDTFHKHKYMLLVHLSNMCVPSYTCLDLDQASNSVIQVRTGKNENQPFFHLKDAWSQACQESNFKSDTRKGNHFVSADMPKYTFVKDAIHESVNCDLSGTFGFVDGPLYFREGNICDGCIYYQPNTYVDRFHMSAFSSSKAYLKRDFVCLASFMIDNVTKSVITKTLNQDIYLCWVFQKNQNGRKIIVLNSAFCDNFFIKRIKNQQIFQLQEYLVSELHILNLPRATCSFASESTHSNFIVQDRCYISRLFREEKAGKSQTGVNQSDTVVEREDTIEYNSQEIFGDNRVHSDTVPTIKINSQTPNVGMTLKAGTIQSKKCLAILLGVLMLVYL